MESIIQDLRYSIRTLLKKPLFAAITIITLALGIGANTAIFSVIDAVLLRPLPYRDADKLVIVWERSRRSERQWNVANPANFADWSEQNSVFSDMAAFTDQTANLTGDGEPEEVGCQFATPNLFSVLGVNAIRGRALTPEDGKPGQPDVVVISYGLWQRRFGGEDDVIGRRILLNGTEATVVGVMPADFKWFIKQGSTSGKPAEMWSPFPITQDVRVRRGRYLTVVARLNPDATLQQAQSEMTMIGNRLEEHYNSFNAGWGVNVVPLREQLSGEVKLTLLLLFAAVGFVLLIACANVANLLLAQASSRGKEMALRTALGAGRGRIIRQLLTESVLLATLGGAFGLLLAVWGVEALRSFIPPELINLQNVKLNAPVLAFTFGVSILTGILFGMVPAIHASRSNLNDALKEGSHTVGGSRNRRIRNAFVVAEIALSLVLLIGAGLMLRSFARLQAVEPGFNPQNLLTMRVRMTGDRYAQDNRRIEFVKQAVERIKELPGVEEAGAVSFLPFAGPGAGTGFEIEGQPKPEPGQGPTTKVCVTDANYFTAMQIPLKRGRLYTPQEAVQMRHVVLINESLARRYFPNEESIGKRIMIHMKQDNEPTEIIGIVADSKFTNLEGDVEPMVYWPHSELVYSSMTFVVRTKGDALSLAGPARDVIRALDANQPIADVRTMESLLSGTLGRARFSALLLTIFAVVAMILASVGIYGVMSYSVTQRTHELGIRIALGAKARDVIQLIVGQGMLLALIGVTIGLVASFFLTRLISTLLFGVSATDILTFAAVSLLLAGVALIACFVPARRAAKTDPMVALRYE
jgi:putative ABC transport system permease protein